MLGELATTAIHAGRSVIVDATFLSESERTGIRAVAAHTNASFQGIWLEAPADVLHDRVRNRMGDASDATVVVVEAQEMRNLGEIAWQRIDASQPIEAVAAYVHQLL
jgi:predicted kinase